MKLSRRGGEFTAQGHAFWLRCNYDNVLRLRTKGKRNRPNPMKPGPDGFFEPGTG